MLRKRLAVIGASAALVLGTATVAMAAGGGNGPGTNPDCPGDCTGQQVQLRQYENVANAGGDLQLRERVQTQLQDGTGDQAVKQVQTRAGEQVRERTQEMAQSGDCDGTCDQVQARERTQEMTQDGDCDGTGEPGSESGPGS